jgi:hypothetical protein
VDDEVAVGLVDRHDLELSTTFVLADPAEGGVAGVGF